MKIERSDIDYGAGSGRCNHNGKLFRVTVMRGGRGTRTNMEYNASRFYGRLEIVFDGEVILNSDEECIEQLEPKEIIDIIEAESKVSFKDGLAAKAEEVRSCLGIGR